MSRSNPNLQNPAHRFMDWSGSRGELTYWDKEKQERIPVKLPLEFLVLDELSTITGYDKQAQSGFWSNEVRSVKREEFTVRNKNGVRYQGPYKDYERDIVLMPKGASYAQSVYIAYQEVPSEGPATPIQHGVAGNKGNWVIGNIKMSGSARSAWFDFTKVNHVQNGKVTVTKGGKQEAQTGPFYPPVFTYTNSTPEEDGIAVTLDKALQIYLSQYLSAPKVEDEHDQSVHTDDIDQTDTFNTDGKANPEQIAEFERLKGEKLGGKQSGTTSKPATMPPTQSGTTDEDADQEAYNRAAVSEVFDNDPPFTDEDLPPEFR